MTIKIMGLDHHGIVAGVIDDLNIVPMLDKHYHKMKNKKSRLERLSKA